MKDIELKNFIALHRVVNQMDRIVSRVFDKNGLSTGQFAVLEALFHKGDMTIGEVQEKILSSSGTMPLIIKNLTQREYITKYSDEKDKRKTILHLTEKGNELISEIFPEVRSVIIDMFEPIDEVQKRELLSILKDFRRK